MKQAQCLVRLSSRVCQPSREEILDSLLPEVDQASAGVKEALRVFGLFGYGSK